MIPAAWASPMRAARARRRPGARWTAGCSNRSAHTSRCGCTSSAKSRSASRIPICMGIADAGGTREAAARRALDGGLLKSLGSHFQVRLYKFGKEPQRVEKTDALDASEPATRIGDTLERVMAESRSEERRVGHE